MEMSPARPDAAEPACAGARSEPDFPLRPLDAVDLTSLCEEAAGPWLATPGAPM